MFTEYTVESMARDRINTWRQEAEADRQVRLAMTGQEIGGVELSARRVRTLLLSGFQWLLHPPATPIDMPFGHSG